MKKLNLWQKLGVSLIGLFVFAYLAIALISGLVISKFFTPKLQAQNMEVKKWQSEILSDLKLLNDSPIFPDKPRNKNAEQLISRHIGWDDGKDNAIVQSPQTPEYKTLVALNADHEQLWKVENMKKLANDPRTSKIDLSWVDELESYDYWNPSSFSYFKNQLELAKELSWIDRIDFFSKMPLPNYGLFQFASIIRAIQLQKHRDPLKGLQILRQSSYLAHTSPNLVGPMIAKRGLDLEQALIETFRIKGWTPVDRNRIEAYKRVSWAWTGLFHINIWPNMSDEFNKFIKPQNGVCGAAGENTMGLGMHDLLAPTVPLETNFSKQLNKVNALYQKLFEMCSMPEYIPFLSPSSKSSMSLFATNKQSDSIYKNSFLESDFVGNQKSSSLKISSISKIPFVRRNMALMLMTVAFPNFTRFYEKREPASNQPLPKAD